VTGNSHADKAYLRWGSLAAPEGWTAETSHALDYFEVSALMAAPGGIFPPVIEPLPPAPPPPGSPPAIPVPQDLGPLGWQLPWGVRLANPPMPHMGPPPGPAPAPPPPPDPAAGGEDAGTAPQTDPGTSMPGEVLGRYKGEFLLHEESRPGRWRFYVRAVDIAGNASGLGWVTLDMRTPDDYVLVDRLDDVLATPEAGGTNAIKLTGPRAGAWVLPVCVPGQTYDEHFSTRSWTSPQDQIDAGYPIYIQPACDQPGVVFWEHDFGKPLGPLQISFAPQWTVLDGGPQVEGHILTKATAGDPWIDAGPTDSLLLPDGTQFVRYELRATSDAAREGLVRLERVSYTLSLELISDAGFATVDASGVTTVRFNVPFVDVRSVQVSVQSGGAARSAAWQLSPDNTSMTVALFDAVGNPSAGSVSWFARGLSAI
jgi:hypothetical protein